MRPTSQQLSIRTARRQFFENGCAPHGLVPDTILRSWQRCLGMGLESTAAPSIEPVTTRELSDIRGRNEELHRLCRSEIEALYADACDTNCVVILSNSQGMILDALGSAEFATRAARVALRPGVAWHETSTGTNAIGTALTERRAVEVRGAEHFFEPHGILSCYAAPILDPRGRVIGALDLSGNASVAHTHALGMVRLAVDHIEHRMFETTPAGCEVLRVHSDAALLGTSHEGVLVFRDRCLIAANRYGLGLLGLDWSVLGKQQFDELFETRPANLANVTQLSLIDGRTVRSRADAGRVAVSVPVTKSATPAEPIISDLATEKLQRQAARMLDADIPVLVLGETGVGKEICARRLHAMSKWSSGPFIAANCAALPASLIESELFGYEAGAFTGARKQGAVGLLRRAQGGVMLLDEIGDMPLELQSRLLRVLQDREVVPVGGSRPLPVRFGLICSTHRQLRDLVQQGLFRADLYYRIAHHTVTLPPLRQQVDLMAVIVQLWERLVGDPDMRLPADVLERLAAYDWPGNYRQLAGVLRSLQVIAAHGEPVSTSNLPPEILAALNAEHGVGTDTLTSVELDAMRAALEACGGNVSAAARRLGISRSTLYRRKLPVS
jgi:sigma-54 dependent transcriptional regulator, acetoin dehydrogenase operon transcriptional activator AcoR